MSTSRITEEMELRKLGGLSAFSLLVCSGCYDGQTAFQCAILGKTSNSEP